MGMFFGQTELLGTTPGLKQLVVSKTQSSHITDVLV